MTAASEAKSAKRDKAIQDAIVAILTAIGKPMMSVGLMFEIRSDAGLWAKLGAPDSSELFRLASHDPRVVELPYSGNCLSLFYLRSPP